MGGAIQLYNYDMPYNNVNSLYEDIPEDDLQWEFKSSPKDIFGQSQQISMVRIIIVKLIALLHTIIP